MERYEIIEYLDEKGYSPQSNLCVFCSITTDGWNRFCPSCREYKGLLNIVDAIDVYGLEILGV